MGGPVAGSREPSELAITAPVERRRDRDRKDGQIVIVETAPVKRKGVGRGKRNQVRCACANG